MYDVLTHFLPVYQKAIHIRVADVFQYFYNCNYVFRLGDFCSRPKIYYISSKIVSRSDNVFTVCNEKKSCSLR